MFEVIIEFFRKDDGAFAGMMRTALPHYYYRGEDIITDISSSALRKIIPSLPYEVHYLVRTVE